MAEFYKAYNEAYTDFVDALLTAFPDLYALQVEQQTLERLMEKDGVDSRRIYAHTKENCSLLYKPVHMRDSSIFVPKENDSRIALLTCSQLYAIWPHLIEREQDKVWKGLACLIQHLSLFEGTAGQLDTFRDLATSFVKDNPNISAANLQQKVFSSMFTNKKMSETVRQMLSDGKASELQKGFGHILRGMNIGGVCTEDTSSSSNQNAESKRPANDVLSVFEEEEDAAAAAEAKEEEDDEGEGDSDSEEEEESKEKSRVATETKGPSSEASDFTSFFRNENDREKKRTRKTAKKKQQSKAPMSELLAFMESREIGETEQAEITQLANSVLGDNANSETSASMQRMFGLLPTMGENPNATEEFNRELKQTFGATDDDLKQMDWSALQNMTTQLRGMTTPAEMPEAFGSIF